MNNEVKEYGLDCIEFTGVIPMCIGEFNEPLQEVIICDSISGCAKYSNNMPIELTLLRTLSDGTEYRMRYKQCHEVIDNSVCER